MSYPGGFNEIARYVLSEGYWISTNFDMLMFHDVDQTVVDTYSSL
jgi:hypothetical protein